MLIKCTECGHDVSDKAKMCLNCGCPVEEILKCLREREIYIMDDRDIKEGMIICSINGKKADVAWIKEFVEKMDDNERYHCKYIWNKLSGDDKDRGELVREYVGTPKTIYNDKALDILWKVENRYNLLHHKVTGRFLWELVDSNFELKEFHSESEMEAIRGKQASASVVRCPYCGSVDVKKLFFGGYAQKQWHCRKCRSDF